LSAKAHHKYTALRTLADANARRKRILSDMLDAPIVNRALWLRLTSHLSGAMSEVYVSGMEKLPLREEEAPILAFSHKKIHDVWSLLELFLARPLDRFHNVVVIAMAGVHTPMYVWLYILPAWFKRGVLQYPALWVARFLGRLMTNFFRAIHTHPVFRDPADMPPTKEEYNATLAGGRLMKMDYAAFRSYANRTTMKSVVDVQKIMSTENCSLLIAPEGKYCHDGSVAPTLDLLGVVAYRKRRATCPLSLSYDELCPDERGRIDAFFFVGDLIPPPVHKVRINSYLRRVRKILQKNNTVTASHLIASVLYDYMEAGRVFTRDDLRRDLAERIRRTLDARVPCDPALTDDGYVDERLARFWNVYGERWFEALPDGYRVDPSGVAEYNDSERTVNDLLWNRNHLVHIPQVRDEAGASRLRSVIEWLRG
jgi:hypothetical protein